MRSRLGLSLVFALLGPSLPSLAQAPEAIFPGAAAWRSALEEDGWLLHGQGTFVLQGHPRFRSPYQGEGSLRNGAVARNTLSTDIILGRRLWEGAEAVVDASVTRGFGLSNSTGVAAFPNNEAFRLGSTDPTVFVPRAFLRQTFALSADTVEPDGDPLRFARPLPRERVTLTIGKFSVWDVFDDNRYAHDARTQFLNWALVGAGAFDFAADARGWTYGAAVEWEDGEWGLRAGAFQVPRRVNGLFMDPAVSRGWQVIAQADHFHRLGDRPGAVRLLYGASRARQASWGEIEQDGPSSFDQNPRGYRLKHMLALNAEQEIAEGIGAFARLSWNDGRTPNFMFTEMDRAVSAGLSFAGKLWGREGDTVGLGGNRGWISDGRAKYLAAGGTGFITGDGRLRRGTETAVETYYDVRIAPGTNVALGYQLILNPAYNRDRGPVSVFSLRTHLEF